MSLTRFQSTRPVWGATPCIYNACNTDVVSIHAPRVGRDATSSSALMACICFNPRAPCGARLFLGIQKSTAAVVSIHAPRVGRDMPRSARSSATFCFNPRAPCGARPPLHGVLRPFVCFNPRAPCGARRGFDAHLIRKWAFQSTRPVWGATAKEVTTSLLCHVFMCIPLHKYDFLGT